MTATLFRNARVLNMGDEPGPRRGTAMNTLGAIDACDVLVSGGVIEGVGVGLGAAEGAEIIACEGRVLMPGFVDAHTHLCWAGDRLDEWESRLAGATYLELLAAGGGIMSTVRAVRAASEETLTRLLLARLDTALREGTTSIEIKSGYGLDTGTELKMLRAIKAADQHWPGAVRPTACIGHCFDPDEPDLVELTIHETLPAVHAEFPEIAIDAYCERGSWSLDQCLTLFDKAASLGHPCRVHADQFNALGMIPAAVSRGFLSVDHLEASEPEALGMLAASQTAGVFLPCSGFHVDARYADGRAFVDLGGGAVVATNANPGSAPCVSMPMAVSLAVRGCGLTAAEAITAATVNAASLLGMPDRGRVAPGARADLILLRHRDERELAHSFGGRAVELVMVGGETVWRDQPAGSTAAS